MFLLNFRISFFNNFSICTLTDWLGRIRYELKNTPRHFVFVFMDLHLFNFKRFPRKYLRIHVNHDGILFRRYDNQSG